MYKVLQIRILTDFIHPVGWGRTRAGNTLRDVMRLVQLGAPCSSEAKTWRDLTGSSAI